MTGCIQRLAKGLWLYLDNEVIPAPPLPVADLRGGGWDEDGADSEAMK